MTLDGIRSRLMDFAIPGDIQELLDDLDQFIEDVIKPIENHGLGSNPSYQLHSADLDGNHVKMYKNLPVSLHGVQALITVN